MTWKKELELYGREAALKTRREAYTTEKYRQRVYGVTPEMYKQKFEAQGGRCAICHQPPPTEGRQQSLNVDHDHEYGRLRDLLCHACNKGLGQFRDNPDLLVEAASYLKRWKWKFMFGSK